MPRNKLAKLLLEDQNDTLPDSTITKFGAEQLTNLMGTLQAQLQTWSPDISNYSPLFEIAKLAFLSDNEAIKLKAHSEIAKYGYPQVRSLEVQAKQDTNITFKVELADYARSATLNHADIEEIESEDLDETAHDYADMVLKQTSTKGREI